MSSRALERLERLCTLSGGTGAVVWLLAAPAQPTRALTALALAAAWTASTTVLPLVFISMAMHVPTAHTHALEPLRSALAMISMTCLALALAAWSLAPIHFPYVTISPSTIDLAALAAVVGTSWRLVLQVTH